MPEFGGNITEVPVNGVPTIVISQVQIINLTLLSIASGGLVLKDANGLLWQVTVVGNPDGVTATLQLQRVTNP